VAAIPEPIAGGGAYLRPGMGLSRPTKKPKFRRWRHRLRVARCAVAAVPPILLAAEGSALVALTRPGEPWIGWAWAVWVLAAALVGARALSAYTASAVRREIPADDDPA
jgi:hypothetical protein